MWRDQYQSGSFRGAEFRTQRHDTSGGRRTVVHELPGRDEPVVEDLGRMPGSYSVEVFVAGTEYFSDRDRLLDALNASGPGTLVHPWLGRMQVSVIDFQLTESTEEGGVGFFRISFVEAGLPVAANQGSDSRSQSIDAADAATGAAPARFADRFSVQGMPAFVEQSAAAIVGGLATVTRFRAAIGGGIGPALRTFEQGLAALGVSGLLRSPFQLGTTLVGLVQAVGALTGSSRRRISAFSAMAAYEPAQDPALGTAIATMSSYTALTAPTPTRRVEVANRDALTHVFRLSAAAELTRAIAGASFSSREEAQAVRAASVDVLDRAIRWASDSGEDERAADYEALRRAIVRDIQQRSPGLPTLATIDTHASEPAIVVANRLAGHAAAAARADDLVARNRVAHPAFLPAGVTLKVIVNG